MVTEGVLDSLLSTENSISSKRSRLAWNEKPCGAAQTPALKEKIVEKVGVGLEGVFLRTPLLWQLVVLVVHGR